METGRFVEVSHVAYSNLMKIGIYLFVAGLTVLVMVAPGQAQVLPSIKEYTLDLPNQLGPIPTYYEEKTGRILFELQHENDPILHFVTLSAGAAWPLDRGSFPYGELPALLRFQRAGKTVQIIADRSYLYRVHGNAEIAAKSVPSPVLAALPILAMDGNRWLVDGTSFLVQDAYGVGTALERVGESVSFDRGRSSVLWPGPIESEVSTHLDVRTTFDVPGRGWPKDSSLPSNTLTVVQRHTFFRAPQGFDPRPADDRIGLAPLSVRDFDEGPEGGYRGGWIQRWRLIDTKNNKQEIRPIRFYIGEGIPAQYRQAIRAGIDYWRRALAAIGLQNAVEIWDLPSGEDPLDLRYPVALIWALRREPMASMGNLVADPRTGEVLKAVIQLDAHWPLVARNEYRAFRPALAAESPTEAEYVDMRITWLVAHEVSHVIAGLSHAGVRETAIGFRQPRLSLSGDKLKIELDQVVPDRPFRYDLWVVAYAYGSGDWRAFREHVEQGLREGLWHTDFEARQLMPESVSRLQSSDVLSELRNAMRVRSILLSHFNASALDPNEPRQRLFERLFPVYFYHRFALEAASRMLGGIRFEQGLSRWVPIPSEDQWSALDTLVEALSPTQLAIPRKVATMMPPAPTASSRLNLRGHSREPGIFTFQTGDTAPIEIEITPGFDPTAWARTLTRMTLKAMLDPLRASRLEMQSLEDPSLPSLSDIIQRLLSATWRAPAADDSAERRFQRLVKRTLLERLIHLTEGDEPTPETQETMVSHLLRLRQELKPEQGDDPAEIGMIVQAIKDIDRILSYRSRVSGEDGRGANK